MLLDSRILIHAWWHLSHQRSHAGNVWAVILRKGHPRQKAVRLTAGTGFQSPPGYLPNKDARRLAGSHTESPNLPYSGLSYLKIAPKKERSSV